MGRIGSNLRFEAVRLWFGGVYPSNFIPQVGLCPSKVDLPLANQSRLWRDASAQICDLRRCALKSYFILNGRFRLNYKDYTQKRQAFSKLCSRFAVFAENPAGFPDARRTASNRRFEPMRPAKGGIDLPMAKQPPCRSPFIQPRF